MSEKAHELKEEIKYQFKIILLGNGGVGKTCLANRFCFNTFSLDTRLTIGLSFNTFSMYAQDKGSRVKIGAAIWDFGGQERFRSLLPQFVSGAHAAVLVYDPTSYKSLKDLYTQWIPILEKNSGEIPRILVQTKNDIVNGEPLISPEIVQEYKEKLGCVAHIKTSSKTGDQVDHVFIRTTELILECFNSKVKLIREKF